MPEVTWISPDPDAGIPAVDATVNVLSADRAVPLSAAPTVVDCPLLNKVGPPGPPLLPVCPAAAPPVPPVPTAPTMML